MVTYEREAANLRRLYDEAVAQCEMLGIPTRDEKFDQIALGELRDALRERRELYGIAEDFSWTATDPADWPFTPPLDQFRAYVEADGANAWKVDIGHYHNALDQAFEEIDRLRAIVEPEV